MNRAKIRKKLLKFLRPDCEELLWTIPLQGKKRAIEFCICDPGLYGCFRFVFMHIRYGILLLAFALPWSTPKVFLLRLFGAKIGANVYISSAVYIDPMFPELLQIEDGVLLGYGVKLFFHEISQETYRLGRIKLCKNAIIGACSALRPGIIIGEEAFVGAMSAVIANVQAGRTVMGVPARVVKKAASVKESSTKGK
ncbi:acyltransferase [Candidatus Riflebacteria bacterium]